MPFWHIVLEIICQFGIILVEILCMTLLETRQNYNLTQMQAASSLGIPLRTYVRYEKDNEYGSALKREAMVSELNEKYEVTETKGLLTLEEIKTKVQKLFNEKYDGQINFCYLFGSYAKGYATEKSDIDICVSTSLTGFKFIGISEAVRSVLHKKVDLIKFENLDGNLELINEILKDGIKIYG